MRWLALLALAGCASELPDTGRVYTCEATFVCDGVEYGKARGGACVPDGDDPDGAFREAVAAKDWGYQCAMWDLKDLVCTTGALAYCTP